MKKTLLLSMVLLLATFQSAFGQWNGYSGTFFFLGTQLSPRSQGMGKVTTTLRGDPFSCAVQPAGLTRLDGAGLGYLFAPSLGYKYSDNSYLKHGVVWVPSRVKVKKDWYNLVLAASYGRADLGKVVRTDETGALLGSFSSYNDIGTISAGYGLDSRASVGASLIYTNQHLEDYGPGNESGISDDHTIGAAVSAQQTGKMGTPFGKGDILLGISLVNLNPLNTNPAAILDWPEDEKPIIFRTGTALVLKLDDLPVDLGFYGEYQVLINSVELSGVHWGSEAWIWDIVALRYGSYRENLSPASYLYKDIRERTWGVSLQLPFQKFWPDIHMRWQLDLTNIRPERFGPRDDRFLEDVTSFAFTLHLTS